MNDIGKRLDEADGCIVENLNLGFGGVANGISDMRQS